MPRSLFLGCDVGGTASCAILVNSKAEKLRGQEGGAGNPHITGFERSAKVIAHLMFVVLADMTSQLAAVTVCISGGESDALRKRYVAYFRDYLSLPEAVRVIVLHDVMAPLGLIIPAAILTSSSERKNFLPSRFATLVAGTGSVAASFAVRDANSNLSGDISLVVNGFSIEMRKKCGGWGPILGEAGSGYAIAVRVLTLSLRITDGMKGTIRDMSSQDPMDREILHTYNEVELRGLALSVLSAAIKHYLAQESCKVGQDFETQLNSLVTFVYDKATTRGQIASFASQVARLAINGNDLCIHVFREAGEELGQLVVAALSLTSTSHSPGEISGALVCCIGGVLRALDEVPAFAHSFRHTVQDVLCEGGEVFVLKSERSPGSEKFIMAFSCAHLAALTMCQSNEHWQMQVAKRRSQVF